MFVTRLADRGPVRDVHNEDCQLHHVPEGCARRRERRRNVRENLPRLGLRVARPDEFPRRVQGDLPRDVDRPPAARLRDLAVADRHRQRRRVVEPQQRVIRHAQFLPFLY